MAPASRASRSRVRATSSSDSASVPSRSPTATPHRTSAPSSWASATSARAAAIAPASSSSGRSTSAVSSEYAPSRSTARIRVRTSGAHRAIDAPRTSSITSATGRPNARARTSSSASAPRKRSWRSIPWPAPSTLAVVSVTSTSPRRSSSPTCTGIAVVARCPETKVPLVEPRSSTVMRSGSTTNAACWRDRLGSSTTRSAGCWRPTTRLPRSGSGATLVPSRWKNTSERRGSGVAPPPSRRTVVSLGLPTGGW